MVSKSSSGSREDSKTKEVEVHSETAAFFDLQGRAVVGRAIDLLSLRKMYNLIKEAGYSDFKIQYLGGLSLLVTFDDDIEAADFLLDVNKWNKWFSSLDMWAGQSMQYERVAWLKFHGLPLHLAENKVFDDVAGLFGKVIHGSQLSLSDKDLSVNYVGILVDHGKRIEESIVLKWKNKKYKVWIIEERDEWALDCVSEENSSERSMDEEEFRGPQVPETEKSDDDVIGEVCKSQEASAGNGSPKENVFNINGEKPSGFSNPQDGDDRCILFTSISGNLNIKKKKPFNISKDKHKSVPKGLSLEILNRPNKRARVDMEDIFDNFGRLGRPVEEMLLGNQTWPVRQKNYLIHCLI
ncbi:hypothetical protein HanRHA438_Chr15g0715431 [Helianthus annuus]|uniref:Nucleotide-binding alpha-beta plait domain-containing protein n=1 Tax=Helianthus annuus TaxID=4232 RepID=A0A9K3E1L0_HELAN|nr:hypothetical protein HanXRQr2_Chr15g0703101 [Helianthus annuus]KAJ0451913.1 hypothetical protein HanHA300_Chr15g0573021 [Helianthus annuus]KAJ0456635.1 hypothetical protein HanIR_Chr15g0764721 [Helianthus annuus]KAJ0473798.1 hypothetical protein HanHA89_Chr15g0622501 [Helianthus annuus]KAJ0649373.1 hypothetical protein HanLR1_Chr15g0583581 [Helianthus annuus]